MIYNQILFIDFDGTITSEETLDGSMRMCVEPTLYAEKAKEMMEGKLTLAQTLRLAFENIPASRLPDILEYVRGVPIRPGLGELLDAMAERGIPVVVISGGLQPYVEEKLAPYREKLLAVHSVGVDTSGPGIRLLSDYERDGELLDKLLIMAQYAYKEAACVGDGHTDIRMAMQCGRVFARDVLAQAMQKAGKAYTPWNDFFDVRKGMRETMSRS